MHDDEQRRDKDSPGGAILVIIGAIVLLGVLAVAGFTWLRVGSAQDARAMAELQAMEATRAAEEAQAKYTDAASKLNATDIAARENERKRQVDQLPKTDQDEVRKVEEFLRTRAPLALSDEEMDLVRKWAKYIDVTACEAKIDQAAEALGFPEFVQCVGMSKGTAEAKKFSFVFCHADERRRMMELARKIKEHGVPNLSDDDKEYFKAHKSDFGRD